MHKREPTLDELLNEPIIRKVMAADGYSAEDIRLFAEAGERPRLLGRVGPDRVPCARRPRNDRRLGGRDPAHA